MSSRGGGRCVQSVNYTWGALHQRRNHNRGIVTWMIATFWMMLNIQTHSCGKHGKGVCGSWFWEAEIMPAGKYTVCCSNAVRCFTTWEMLKNKQNNIKTANTKLSHTSASNNHFPLSNVWCSCSSNKLCTREHWSYMHPKPNEQAEFCSVQWLFSPPYYAYINERWWSLETRRSILETPRSCDAKKKKQGKQIVKQQCFCVPIRP
jgi:hypothetical protein